MAAVDNQGHTVDQTYDFNKAITDRMNPIGAIGAESNAYSAQAAQMAIQKRLAQSQAIAAGLTASGGGHAQGVYSPNARIPIIGNTGTTNTIGAAGSSFKYGYKNQSALIEKYFPGTHINSGYRPGAITSSGNKSWHASGRAIDLPASMAMYQWLLKNYGSTSKEIIFTPGGRTQIKNGKRFNYTGQVAKDHVGHIHWAY